MTLPRFLDCAYVLLLDEYQRAGQDLLTAVDKLSQWAPRRDEREKQVDMAAQNTAAMQSFQAMMSGVRKA
jgi:hypothetical protein